MPIDPERRDMIQANATLVVREMADLSGSDHGLGADGVAWVEGFIERQRTAMAPDAARGLVSVLGSYLGEAIIAAVPGADWDDDGDGALGVRFANGDMAFPFGKVEKQLAEGVEAGESILSFYNISVGYVATGKLGAASGEGAP